MRPHGRARVSARNPRAFGICDRCGFLYNHVNLQWQYDWAGASLINKRILVCDECNDVPQSQLRAIVVPADPVPILNPRVQDYAQAETNFRVTQGNTVNAQTGIPVPGGNQRTTEGDNNRVTQQTGAANGSKNLFPGTRFAVPEDANAGVPYNAVGVPNTGRLSTVTDYVVWTNDSPNYNWWTDNEEAQMYWGA